MLRLTLAQMRRSTGRLVAAGLAITIGTAFIAATLLGSGIMRDTTYGAMTAEIAGADVVVRGTATPLTPEDLDEVRALPGVAVADGEVSLFTSLRSGGREDWVPLHAVSSPGLERTPLNRGTLPSASGEVAVNASSAERLGVEVGDVLATQTDVRLQDTPASDSEQPAPVTDELVITGILADPSPLAGPGTLALVSGGQLDAWIAEAGSTPNFSRLLVGADDGASPADVAGAVRSALPQSSVQTGEQYAEQRTADLTGSSYLFTALILGFGALAMFVAAIVITNTFQVLVAQRTHTLAMLRAVGATKGQVRRSVLLEALLLGTVSGGAGLLLGLGLAQVALWVLAGQDLDLPLPERMTVTAAVVVVPVVTGALVTWLAALAPARAATAVSPLAALRPPQPPDPRGASRLRVTFSLLLIILGAGLIAGGVVLGGTESVSADTAILGGLGLGITGGVISFAGVMLGVVFIAPGVVRMLGGLVRRLGGGTPVRLTTANATRNPHRTAATATALVIGVALVTLMSTGAVSARASLDAMLRSQFPVDLMVQSTSWDPQAGTPLGLTATQVDTVRSSEGVLDVVELSDVQLPLTGGTDTGYAEIPVTAVDPAAVDDVLRDERVLAELGPETIVAGSEWAREMGVEDGDTLTVDDVAVSVVLADLGSSAFVTTGLAERAAEEAPVSQLWVRLAEGGSAQTITSVQDRLTEANAAVAAPDGVSTPYVSGPAAERAVYEQVINTLLAIVVGLLAVAVVIALIGVANTLSLSVIERRRESALLRAMGLTRRQLRTMLGVEGVFLALTGVLIGVLLGLLYGWAGTAVLLGQTDDVTLAVPWAHVAAIVGVAVLAGLAASVLPARSAVRTPPVAALAAE